MSIVIVNSYRRGLVSVLTRDLTRDMGYVKFDYLYKIHAGHVP